ncbi:MAG: CHRD domain-containing protein [Gammaproteobacteria bacterium]
MRFTMACISIGALVLAALSGCQRAETPTTDETPPMQDTTAQDARTQAQEQGATPFYVSLSGAEEIPGPGDADGAGTAQVTLDESKGEVCYELNVENIQAATAAHIHTGAAGSAGDVAVPLGAPAEGTSKGCATADAAVVRDIAQNPANYYVNVHNAEFPQGALRGQLQR